VDTDLPAGAATVCIRAFTWLGYLKICILAMSMYLIFQAKLAVFFRFRARLNFLTGAAKHD
jgi:hypothetical protein